MSATGGRTAIGTGHWLYQARRVATQANVAGGAVIVDISPAAGQTVRLVSLGARNSGTNTLNIFIYDEDNAINPYQAYLANVGSAAGNTFHLPSLGSAASASANIESSQNIYVAAGQKLSIVQTGAGAQNDTLTVAVTLVLIGSSVEPTWDKSRSTNAADVTLSASTITSNVVTPLLAGYI